MNKSTTTRANSKVNSTRRARKEPRTLGIKNVTWRKVGIFLNSRSRDLALSAIVLGAFVAVYDGSRYSAITFSFVGLSAIAFAIMPDALMVLSAAKMRQVGITKAQWTTAHRWMKIALGFSLLTNMIAAFLRNCPPEWINEYVQLTGAVAYHGMIVVFLQGAVDVLTKTREDRKVKAPNASEAPAPSVQAPAQVSPLIPVHARPSRWLDTGLAWALGTKSPS
jgi:hypothetical protein